MPATESQVKDGTAAKKGQSSNAQKGDTGSAASKDKTASGENGND